MTEQPRKRESGRERSREFLEGDLRISYEIAPSAREHLPEITREDIESGRERYRLFLGRWRKDGSDAHVSIEAIVEFDDDPRAVIEGKYEVLPDLAYMKKLFDALKKHDLEYADLEVVGDIHTHPVFLEDMPDGIKPWYPSAGDLEDIARHYERGTISADKPFVFAIAVPNPNRTGETAYAYYHMFKEGEVWKYRNLNN